MTYEFLPRPEPGQPSMRFSPGFRDGVRQRIKEHKRQKRRRRTIAIALTALCLAGGVFLVSARMMDGGPTPSVPQKQAGPVVTPLVNPAPAQQEAPPQNAVQQARTTAPPARHDHPVATASAEAQPEGFVLIVDGKSYRCPADFFHPQEKGTGQVSPIEQVRDGKYAPTPSTVLRRCRPEPAPRE